MLMGVSKMQDSFFFALSFLWLGLVAGAVLRPSKWDCKGTIQADKFANFLCYLMAHKHAKLL